MSGGPCFEKREHALGTDTATFSANRTYRYLLTRTWGDGPAAAWIMLNPSTADAFADDPTIWRVIGFSRREGCGSVAVVNLYGLRATDPAELWKHPDPVGWHGDDYLTAPARLHADLVIAAWGAGGARKGRGNHAATLLRHIGVDLQCLGTTKDGHPRHPLYVRGDQPLMPYRGAAGDD